MLFPLARSIYRLTRRFCMSKQARFQAEYCFLINLPTFVIAKFSRNWLTTGRLRSFSVSTGQISRSFPGKQARGFSLTGSSVRPSEVRNGSCRVALPNPKKGDRGRDCGTHISGGIPFRPVGPFAYHQMQHLILRDSLAKAPCRPDLEKMQIQYPISNILCWSAG